MHLFWHVCQSKAWLFACACCCAFCEIEQGRPKGQRTGNARATAPRRRRRVARTWQLVTHCICASDSEPEKKPSGMGPGVALASANCGGEGARAVASAAARRGWRHGGGARACLSQAGL